MSHNVLSAFFSSTDVQDEVAARYFAVFGKILNDIPELAAKIAFNRQFKSLTYDDLFDDEVDKLHIDSDYNLNFNELKHLIKETVKVVPTYGYNKSVQTISQKTEFKKSTTKDLEYYSAYNSSNYFDYYDYHDFYGPDPFLKGTIFEKEPDELSIFSFDFKKLFSEHTLKSNCYNDIHNLYVSMTNLLIDTFPDELDLDSLKETLNEAISDSLSLVDFGDNTNGSID